MKAAVGTFQQPQQYPPHADAPSLSDGAKTLLQEHRHQWALGSRAATAGQPLRCAKGFREGRPCALLL